MLRRTFAKALLGICSIPLWPFPTLKEKISHFDIIKRLLKDKKDFCIVSREDGLLVNVVRAKRTKINVKDALQQNFNPQWSQQQYDYDTAIKRRKLRTGR